MAITMKRLLGHDAVVTLRDGRTAADAPASGDWTPDNLNADEIAANMTADDVTLDAHEWSEVWVIADFVDGVGAPHVGGSVDVDLLMKTVDPLAPSGRRWKVAGSFEGVDTDTAVPVPVAGHDVAFRISSLTLGGATAVHVRVTGGEHLRNVPR